LTAAQHSTVSQQQTQFVLPARLLRGPVVSNVLILRLELKAQTQNQNIRQHFCLDWLLCNSVAKFRNKITRRWKKQIETTEK
jgi:hypothetical protein